MNETTVSNKSWAMTFWLCLFLGLFGGHYFYLRRTGKALLYLFTAGLFTVGWIIDIFAILGGGMEDKFGRVVKRKKK